MKSNLYLFFLILFISCNGYKEKAKVKQEVIEPIENAVSSLDCNQLPQHYSSYHEAIVKIKAGHFQVQESANTSQSSWVRSASFYSCGGSSGFFILKTDEEEYIHSQVPYSVWQGFKNASSFGSYYDHNIKHKYYFNLN